MFNFLHSIDQNIYELTIYSFFVLFLIRHLIIKNILLIFFYHIALFCYFFIMTLGGGSVINDAHVRLKQFIDLEKNNKIEHAIQNPHNYDSMLVIDLNAYKSSDEFKSYIKRQERYVDENEAKSIGWFFVFLSDAAMLFVYFIRRFIRMFSQKSKNT